MYVRISIVPVLEYVYSITNTYISSKEIRYILYGIDQDDIMTLKCFQN